MKITVSIINSTIVRPAQDRPNQRLWLSNMDLLQGRNHLRTVYFYKPDGSSNFFETKLLKEALGKVLVTFYPVAGRLAKDEKGRIEIDCNGEGVLFVEAETDSYVSELGDVAPCSELLQLLPKLDYSRDMSCDPLVILQVTTFSCGGVCLGVGWHHTLADGEGAIHFINSWSNIARGLSISNPPFLQRTILQARNPPTPSVHIEYDPHPTLISGTHDAQSTETKPDPQVNATAVFKISLEQINAIKSKVNNVGKIKNYSTYEILTAHIWRCTSKARCLCNDQQTKLFVPVDGRSRLHPPLPPGYFGNVIFRATPIASCGELLSEPLVNTVERIHKAIKHMDDGYLRSAIDCLENPYNPEFIVPITGFFRCPNLIVVSWMRLPLSCADFGWGQPIILRPASQLEGSAYLTQSFEDDGNLLLVICLQEDHMKSFEKLLYVLD